MLNHLGEKGETKEAATAAACWEARTAAGQKTRHQSQPISQTTYFETYSNIPKMEFHNHKIFLTFN